MCISIRSSAWQLILPNNSSRNSSPHHTRKMKPWDKQRCLPYCQISPYKFRHPTAPVTVRHCDDVRNQSTRRSSYGDHGRRRRPALRRLPRRRRWRQLRRGRLCSRVFPRVPLPLHRRRKLRRWRLPCLRRAVAPDAGCDPWPRDGGRPCPTHSGNRRDYAAADFTTF
jgi:hypothetical protein